MLILTSFDGTHLFTLIGERCWFMVGGVPARGCTARRFLDRRLVQITHLRPDAFLAFSSPSIVEAFYSLEDFMDEELKAFRADVDMGLVA